MIIGTDLLTKLAIYLHFSDQSIKKLDDLPVSIRDEREPKDWDNLTYVLW